VGWADAVALRPDIVLSDVRANAAPPDRLADSAHWAALVRRAQILPWNPEAAASHHAHARFLNGVADAM